MEKEKEQPVMGKSENNQFETKTISRMEDGLLNEKHALFKYLLEKNPDWWEVVKNDSELYIEIRKENKIMVYYRGGRLAGAEYKKRSKTIEVTAHPKYLGHTDRSDSKYYKQNNDHTPIYQPCEDWIVSNLEGLKDNIIEHYTGDEKGEDTSEKLIQGKLIIQNRDKYLDSEFSHRLYDGQRLQVRIDLVKIENGQFVFEELKRIVDGRMLTRDGEPEILKQMQNYKGFLSANKDELAIYYRQLYKIKQELGLPVPAVANIDEVTVNETPQLTIANIYEDDNRRRENRFEQMEMILKKASINYRIIIPGEDY